MIRKYEVVYIFDSALEEAQINERLAGYHALLKTSDRADPVTNSNHWGKRTLAYPIRRRETGYYVVVQLETDPSLLGEFERALKLDEALIRYLLVIDEGETPPPSEDAHEAESEVDADKLDERTEPDAGESARRPRTRYRTTLPIDYKDEKTLSRFITDRGKIVPRRLSGLSARRQRRLSTAIKRARHLALLPYIKGHRK